MPDSSEAAGFEDPGKPPYVPKRPTPKRNDFFENGSEEKPGFLSDESANEEKVVRENVPAVDETASGKEKPLNSGGETPDGGLEVPNNDSGNFWDNALPNEEVARSNDTKAHALADTLDAKKPQGNQTQPTRPKKNGGDAGGASQSGDARTGDKPSRGKTSSPGKASSQEKPPSPSGREGNAAKLGGKNATGGSVTAGGAAAGGEVAASTAKAAGESTGKAVTEGVKNVAESANTSKEIATNTLRAAGDAKNIKDNLQAGDVGGAAKAAVNTGVRTAGLAADALGAGGVGSAVANKVAPIVSKHGKKIAIVPIVGIPLTLGASFMVVLLLLSSIIAAVTAIMGTAGSATACQTPSGTSPGGGVGTIVITDQGTKENIKYIWDTLRANGMSEYATAGIMGNMQQESTFQPGAINPSSDVKGLVQWSFGTRKNGEGINGNRWEALEVWAKQNSYDPATVKGQMAMLLYEMTHVTTYNGKTQFDPISKNLVARMNAATSPEEASQTWISLFEGAEGQENVERQSYARQIHNSYAGTAQAGTPPAAPATPATPAAPVAVTPVVSGVAPKPDQVKAALEASGVKLVVENGWDQEWDLPSRQADWHPIGVMLHHTGNGTGSSLEFLRDIYVSDRPLLGYDGLTGGRRGAALLIDRDGTVHLLRATRGPQAGDGGPMNLAGDQIPEDNANGYTYGIEIESQGSSADIKNDTAPGDGFTTAQVEATARSSAALLTLVGKGPDHLTDHKAWAAAKQGKPDLVGNSVEIFRARTAEIMQSGGGTPATSASSGDKNCPQGAGAGQTEVSPADCPATVPVGSIKVEKDAKTLCSEAVSGAVTPEAAKAIKYAFANLGASYDQGNRLSINPPVFDCSSFVGRAYESAGANIVKNGAVTPWLNVFGFTGAYMPGAYEGTNLQRVNSLAELRPGDIIIQFNGSDPAGSQGNAGHAQMYLGNNTVIQSTSPASDVAPHSNIFSNEWYFRWNKP